MGCSRCGDLGQEELELDIDRWRRLLLLLFLVLVITNKFAFDVINDKMNFDGAASPLRFFRLFVVCS